MTKAEIEFNKKMIAAACRVRNDKPRAKGTKAACLAVLKNHKAAISAKK